MYMYRMCMCMYICPTFTIFGELIHVHVYIHVYTVYMPYLHNINFGILLSTYVRPTLRSELPPHKYPPLSTSASAFPSKDTAMSAQQIPAGDSFLHTTSCNKFTCITHCTHIRTCIYNGRLFGPWVAPRL